MEPFKIYTPNEKVSETLKMVCACGNQMFHVYMVLLLGIPSLLTKCTACGKQVIFEQAVKRG